MPADRKGMSAPTPDPYGQAVHPAILQSVLLTLRPTAGDEVPLETRVLDLEPQTDGQFTLVVASPEGQDPLQHHFDATVSWTYPLGRIECPVSSRPGRRAYGNVWLLRPSAQSLRIQDRNFFRARVSVPVLLTWEVEPPELADLPELAELAVDAEPERLELTAIAVDLGEGGLLALARSEPPAVGTLIEATVRVDGDNLKQPARIVRHVAFASGGTGVAVAFLDPKVHGDRLRTLVFESERRRRRIR